MRKYGCMKIEMKNINKFRGTKSEFERVEVYKMKSELKSEKMK